MCVSSHHDRETSICQLSHIPSPSCFSFVIFKNVFIYCRGLNVCMCWMRIYNTAKHIWRLQDNLSGVNSILPSYFKARSLLGLVHCYLAFEHLGNFSVIILLSSSRNAWTVDVQQRHLAVYTGYRDWTQVLKACETNGFIHEVITATP